MTKKNKSLSFHNIGYDVTIKNSLFWKDPTTKNILNDVCGVMNPGINAIMGPSGSGKTTLLDILACRDDPSANKMGRILFNGSEIKRSEWRAQTGYVVQDDVIMGTLTVRENILFSANLRLPSSKYSKAERVAKVDDVINDLGLIACADTKVGNEFTRGISGGERKRVSIAMEMIKDPDVLFLDEPTTGLDAFTAASIMTLLCSLGEKGRVVILSIHQPRYSIFSMFDHLIILSCGCMAFNGKASVAVDYFTSIGFKCPLYQNPADYFLDVVNGEISPEKVNPDHKEIICTTKNNNIAIEDDEAIDEKVALSKLLIDIFNLSSMAKEERNKLKEIEGNVSEEATKGGVEVSESSTAVHQNGFFYQLSHIFGRTLKDLVRNPVTSLVPILLASMIGLIVGMIFFQMKANHIGIQGRTGVIFFIVTTQVMNCVQALEVFIQKRKIFMHESASGYYRTSAYFIARVVADLIPNRWIPIFFLSAISYFMIGFKLEIGKFLFFYLSIALCGTASASMAFVVSSSFQVYGIATLFLTVPCFIMMLFGGYLINTTGLLGWLQWLKYFSIMRYGMNGILINEMQNMVFVDDRNGLNMSAVNPCYIETLNSTVPNCKTGEEYLQHQDIRYDSWGLWQNIVALATMSFAFLILSYFQLKRTRR